jgi:hypothetical protein
MWEKKKSSRPKRVETQSMREKTKEKNQENPLTIQQQQSKTFLFHYTTKNLLYVFRFPKYVAFSFSRLRRMERENIILSVILIYNAL